MNSGNKIKDVVEKIREYERKNGKLPRGAFTLTKNNAFRKSAKGNIRVD